MELLMKGDCICLHVFSDWIASFGPMALVVLVHYLSTLSIVFLNFLSRNGFLLISGGSTMSWRARLIHSHSLWPFFYTPCWGLSFSNFLWLLMVLSTIFRFVCDCPFHLGLLSCSQRLTWFPLTVVYQLLWLKIYIFLSVTFLFHLDSLLCDWWLEWTYICGSFLWL